MNSVQIRSFFWSVFSHIRTEYGEILTSKNSVFGHFSCSDFCSDAFFHSFFCRASLSLWVLCLLYGVLSWVFRATRNFFLIFWLIKEYQEIKTKPKCDWFKGLHSNLRDFGFRNLFCLYKISKSVFIFLRDFITMNSPFKLA